MRILYLDLDTTRPDHLGCYGYHRDTSPNLDRIAAEGVRFDNYYCSDAPCLPSRTALMTGRFGIHTGVVGHHDTGADMRLEGEGRGFRSDHERTCLPRLLRTAGLKTTLISPFGERHSAFHFYAGFSEIHNTGGGGNESAEDVTPTVLDWVERNGDGDDWYLHINYWDPHSVFRVPEAFGNPFEDVPPPDWITPETIEKHRKMVGPHTAQEVNMYDDQEWPDKPRHVGQIRDMASWKKHIDGYDCGIAYMDQHIGQLFAALEAKGVMEDLIVIVSSDHGENHGELGIYSEHGTADQITCRIPMIVRWPGCKQGHVATGLHHNVDLLPTLFDMLKDRLPKNREWWQGDVAMPPALWDGVSYADTLRDGADRGKDYLVLGQCAHVCQRGVRFGPWMYVRTYHDGFHLFPKEMLFNIEEDPYEQHDLAESRRDLCMEAVYYLNEWHDQMMATMPDAVDPLWTVMRERGPCHAADDMLPPYLERLKATGRGWAEAELRRRHPRAFAD